MQKTAAPMEAEFMEAAESFIWQYAPDCNKTFFDTADFPWTEVIKENIGDIQEELRHIMENLESVPLFQAVSPLQNAVTEGTNWRTLFFHSYGNKIENNCAKCPKTAKLLELIPGLTTAMFSILVPGKHIPPHRGPYKGVLRYLLGLKIPTSGTASIRVGDDYRIWTEGDCMIFDDTHMHEAWNDTDEQRAVLFVDFIRPLPYPADYINKLTLERMAHHPCVVEATRNVRKFSWRV